MKKEIKEKVFNTLTSIFFFGTLIFVVIIIENRCSGDNDIYISGVSPLISKGDSLSVKGDYLQATNFYLSALDKDEDNAAYGRLIYIYTLQKKYSEALLNLDKYEKEHKSTDLSKMMRANIYMLEGLRNEALPIAQSIAKEEIKYDEPIFIKNIINGLWNLDGKSEYSAMLDYWCNTYAKLLAIQMLWANSLTPEDIINADKMALSLCNESPQLENSHIEISAKARESSKATNYNYQAYTDLYEFYMIQKGMNRLECNIFSMKWLYASDLLLRYYDKYGYDKAKYEFQRISKGQKTIETWPTFLIREFMSLNGSSDKRFSKQQFDSLFKKEKNKYIFLFVIEDTKKGKAKQFDGRAIALKCNDWSFDNYNEDLGTYIRSQRGKKKITILKDDFTIQEISTNKDLFGFIITPFNVPKIYCDLIRIKYNIRH